jgi:hypothetical protein
VTIKSDPGDAERVLAALKGEPVYTVLDRP